MNLIILNFYLLICIGIQATAYTVHFISINDTNAGLLAILKSGLCVLWIICCMVSMVKITKTYMYYYIEKKENKDASNKNNRKLYAILLLINTFFSGIALTMTVFR